MPEPYRTRRRVEFRDTDAAGIMHFSTFFTAMEQAEHQMLRDLGLSVMHPYQDATLSWPRVSAHCDYHVPLRFEDIVDIEVGVSRIGTRSVAYRFQFFHDKTLVATGELVAVCCVFSELHSATSIAIPEEIRVLLARHAVTEGS